MNKQRPPLILTSLAALTRDSVSRRPVLHAVLAVYLAVFVSLFLHFLTLAALRHLFNPWDTPQTPYDFHPRRPLLPKPSDYIVLIEGAKPRNTWEGFGTSLCWWGMGVGGSQSEQLFADLVFSLRDEITVPDGRRVPGLGLEILRYNMGGFGWPGDSVGGMVESSSPVPWYRRLEGFSVRDEGHPNGSWDWSRDANQRSMMMAAKKLGVSKFEFFSNAPMWWMTEEKSSAGGRLDLLQGQAFVSYVAEVVNTALHQWHIPVVSVELFNEPSAGWWNYGQTTQEGCNIKRNDQHTLLKALRTEMSLRNLTQVRVSSSDENGLDTGLVTYVRLRNEMDQVNVHSYYGLTPWRKNRTRRILRAIVVKDLWMSEYGDGDGSGRTLAQTILEDFNFMHPTAWVYWQVVEANNDWGMLNALFFDEYLKNSSQRGAFTKLNRKYFIFAHFTRFIRSGSLIIPSTDRDTVSAYDEAKRILSIVFMTDSQAHSVSFVLDNFLVLDQVVNITVTSFEGEKSMPELPEVERGRRLMHDHCVGRKIVRVDSTPDTIVYTGGITNTTFAETLLNKTIEDTYRYGKVFFLRLNQSPHPVLHFGMTGSVRVKGQDGLKYKDFNTDGDEWPPRFWKFVIVLSDGCEIAFTDPRRLAKIRLAADPLNEPPISELGFDPVHSMPEVGDFGVAVRRRNMPVKALLLDQAFSAGIGNWVADEVLYHAKVHPAQNTQTLLDEELSSLHGSITTVINTACAVNADSDLFPDTWLFHYRCLTGASRWEKAKSKKHSLQMPNGNAISFVTIGGRTTAVVEAEQKLRGSLPVKKKRKPAKENDDEEEDDEEEEDAPATVIMKKRKTSQKDAERKSNEGISRKVGRKSKPRRTTTSQEECLQEDSNQKPRKSSRLGVKTETNVMREFKETAEKSPFFAEENVSASQTKRKPLANTKKSRSSAKKVTAEGGGAVPDNDNHGLPNWESGSDDYFGPEKSVIPLSDHVIPTFNLDKRSDSRTSESLRPFFAKTGMIRQANGSAYMEAGKLKVVCGVYGPRQQVSGKRSSETGVLVCDFKFTPFSLKKRKGFMRESQETENAMLMKQALTPAVRLHKYPKSEIDIFAMVLEGDGMASALCLAISCASLALADAGIEMFDTVAACSAGFFEKPSKSLQDRTLALDCTADEEEFQIGSLVIAYMPSMREVTHFVHSGEIAISSMTEAMDLCIDGCSKIHDALRETLIESLKGQEMEH
ncbi:hypothetical protein HDU67_006634 [Dinochytrium kinnereticum]|nr:hypothetical protein HDU67_006634 [Dinochytrium kinnereticum]